MCQKLVGPLLDIQDTCTVADRAVIFPSNLWIKEIELDGVRFSLVCCAENIHSLVSSISRGWGKKGAAASMSACAIHHRNRVIIKLRALL